MCLSQISYHSFESFETALPGPKEPHNFLVYTFILRIVHTATTKRIFYAYWYRCSVNTNIYYHDAHFSHCCCHYNWVQNPFRDGNKMIKIMPLSSQCEQTLPGKRTWSIGSQTKVESHMEKC